jgi:hypothetical protein
MPSSHTDQGGYLPPGYYAELFRLRCRLRRSTYRELNSWSFYVQACAACVARFTQFRSRHSGAKPPSHCTSPHSPSFRSCCQADRRTPRNVESRKQWKNYNASNRPRQKSNDDLRDNPNTSWSGPSAITLVYLHTIAYYCT